MCILNLLTCLLAFSRMMLTIRILQQQIANSNDQMRELIALMQDKKNPALIWYIQTCLMVIYNIQKGGLRNLCLNTRYLRAALI